MHCDLGAVLSRKESSTRSGKIKGLFSLLNSHCISENKINARDLSHVNSYIILQLSPIPTLSSINLGSMKFDDFSLNADQMLTAAVRMFLDFGLIDEFNIDYQVLVTLCWQRILSEH